MPNMSYCRFENTYHDLEDCVEALRGTNIEKYIEEANLYEKPYFSEEENHGKSD